MSRGKVRDPKGVPLLQALLLVRTRGTDGRVRDTRLLHDDEKVSVADERGPSGGPPELLIVWTPEFALQPSRSYLEAQRDRLLKGAEGLRIAAADAEADRPFSRDALAAIAQTVADKSELLQGLRAVVVIAEDSGEYVGVGMSTNTSLQDAMALLRCALERKDAK
jgi:hypothetical protein